MDPDLFYSYIIFSDRCTLKKIILTSRKHHVINRYNILSAINANAKWYGIKMSSNEIDKLYIKLQPLTQVGKAKKLDHIYKIQKKLSIDPEHKLEK